MLASSESGRSQEKGPETRRGKFSPQVNGFLGSPNGLFCCGLRNGLFQLCPPGARQILLAGALRSGMQVSFLKATCAKRRQRASLPRSVIKQASKRMRLLKWTLFQSDWTDLPRGHGASDRLKRNSGPAANGEFVKRKFCRVSWRRLFDRCVFKQVRAKWPQ